MPSYGTYATNVYSPASNWYTSYRSVFGVKMRPKGKEESSYSSESGFVSGYYSNAGFAHSITSSSGMAATQAVFNGTGPAKQALLSAYERAYGRLQGELSGYAANLTALAEARSSLDMIFQRMTSIRKAYKALKKGNLRSALNYLTIKKPMAKHRRTRWSKPSEASALWLEYWFGWAPMVQDIYNSLQILYNLTPFLERTVEGKGSGYASPAPVSTVLPWATEYHSYGTKVMIRLATTVTVSNPNEFLLARLGLLNPASTALELVPFSWLLNWVSNVGSFVQSFSDEYGLSFDKGFQTLHVKTVGRDEWSWETGKKRDGFTSSIQKTRRSSWTLTRPPLRWNLPDRLSLTRAATATSLVILLFAPDVRRIQTRM